MSDDIAIKVDNVSKSFRLPHEKQNSIKGSLISMVRGGKRSYEKQQVLKDVSFEIKKGEFFGIVGRNGSGKSTLLKMLAGIYSPSKGKIHINGKLTPFIELGVGFNQELTGRDNVYLNGALLGFNRDEMLEMYDEIVAFAELERFMDQKLKNYSSGMQVRLAFSIAIRAKSDILLIDEVLAVGDAAFQRKCLDYFGQLKTNNQTVVFITHDMASVRKYCDRAVLLDSGELISEDDTEGTIANYMNLFLEDPSSHDVASSERDLGVPIGMSSSAKIDTSKVKISKVWAEDAKGQICKKFDDSSKVININFVLEALEPCGKVVPGVVVRNTEGEFITATNSIWGKESKDVEMKEKGQKTTVTFKLPNIYEQGDYIVAVNAVSEDLETFLAWDNHATNFYSSRKFLTGGKAYPMYEVELKQ